MTNKTQIPFYAGVLMMLCGLYAGSGFGQEISLPTNHMIKTYMNIGFPEVTTQTIAIDSFHQQVTRQQNAEGGWLSLAYTREAPSGAIHEFELSRLSFWNRDNQVVVQDSLFLPMTISGANVRGVYAAARYEYMQELHKTDENRKTKIYLGGSAQPFFYRNVVRPLNSQSFPTTDISAGIKLALIPRVTQNLTDKLFLDVNIPIQMVTTDVTHNRVENPSFTASQQSISTINFMMDMKYMLRAGIGYRL
ncbi:MAG: hypothetical protein H6608_05045 [Flavobacteriales bacterium]|nr:hypothetical protein [Bacteroidota bacterium]MCB9240471.1 hypothetical protein [Flavobacteriales bacterium]